ncbi:transmembrane and coiled-coil domain-containing protein 5B-like [Rhineura floridana]|uniref:transmembrane and coiled-coil domain-containing protein 5B-like n=1 Tax=Rhineura floridana TaxID=261503 RepID=UPI002AC856D9|nr:transmembrane and coiled-coil domain-containing protein 5B-like [Rhineura floridana]
MSSSVEDLSLANENLRCQINDLRETVACLDSENQELLKENRCIKDHNRSLQGTADTFKATMEEMQKKVEDIRERMDHANMKIHELDIQNKSLVKANEELNKELHEVSSQVALFQDYKAAQEKDLLEMQNLSAEVKKYLKSLEERLEETEHHYHAEKSHSSQLKEKVGTLLQLRQNQRNDIKDLQAQLETCVQQATILRLDQENRVQMGSLMHEIVEAKLVDVALNRSKSRKAMYWLWKLGKFLTILVLGCILLLVLALSYTYFFNQQFIAETVLVFLSEQNINKIVQGFAHYLTWRNDGLLPF